MLKRKIFILLLIIGAIIFLGLFLFLSWNPNFFEKDSPYQPVTPANQSEGEQEEGVKKFVSFSELQNFLETQSSQNGNIYYSQDVRGMGVALEGMVDTAVPSALGDDLSQEKYSEESSGMGSGGVDYSETNIQVEGVDEADIIKTDGKYIYALARNVLFIIDAYPASSSQIISKIEFSSNQPQDIFINEDRLAVYGYDNTANEDFMDKSFYRWNNYSFLKIFDISDRANPKEVRDLKFEGSLADSRMIGDYVYLVTAYHGYQIMPDQPIVPRVLEGEKIISNTCVNDGCIMPDIYYFPGLPYYSDSMTSVYAINLQDENATVNSESYLLPNGHNLYASLNNIYITYTKYLNEYEIEMETYRELAYPMLSADDQDRIARIEAVDDFILNKEEKMSKVFQIIMNYLQSLPAIEQESFSEQMGNVMRSKLTDLAKEMEKTIIYRINIADGEIAYSGQGEVVGQVLNQFAMDEKDGYFRIATTKHRSWSRYLDEGESKSYNNLYILDENLKLAGALENIAVDENIYSVRFMQDRAYMVTFEQIDPLFVIDLSDPTNPTVLGELKIPGYSNYLHPYNDELLIGLGKETELDEDDRVRVKGIKLSLFDVSDVNSPQEIDNYILGDAGSDSVALYNHKAFLFAKNKNLLAIPVVLRKSSGNDFYGELEFSGAVIFDIDETGFTEKGRIDHSDNGQPAEDYWRGGYRYYDNNVQRILYIDDNLYTFSNKYLKINNISNLDEISSLTLLEIEDIDIIPIKESTLPREPISDNIQ